MLLIPDMYLDSHGFKILVTYSMRLDIRGFKTLVSNGMPYQQLVA